jgi:hypothetical protein
MVTGGRRQKIQIQYKIQNTIQIRIIKNTRPPLVYFPSLPIHLYIYSYRRLAMRRFCSSLDSNSSCPAHSITHHKTREARSRNKRHDSTPNPTHARSTSNNSLLTHIHIEFAGRAHSSTTLASPPRADRTSGSVVPRHPAPTGHWPIHMSSPSPSGRPARRLRVLYHIIMIMFPVSDSATAGNRQLRRPGAYVCSAPP